MGTRSQELSISEHSQICQSCFFGPFGPPIWGVCFTNFLSSAALLPNIQSYHSVAPHFDDFPRVFQCFPPVFDGWSRLSPFFSQFWCWHSILLICPLYPMIFHSFSIWSPWFPPDFLVLSWVFVHFPSSFHHFSILLLHFPVFSNIFLGSYCMGRKWG